MKLSQIKTYIMAVLIDNKDKFVVCPTLCIDRLFDGLELDAVQEIAGWAESVTSMTPDVKSRVWDRYLMPRLAQADMYVKVFDLQGRM